MSSNEPTFLRNLRAIGDRLRLERERLGLKQADFSELGGGKRASQSLYETAKTPFSIDYLIRLGQNGVDIGYVVTGIRDSSLLSPQDYALLDSFKQLDEPSKPVIMAVIDRMLGKPTDLRPLVSADLQNATLHDKVLPFKAEGQGERA